MAPARRDQFENALPLLTGEFFNEARIDHVLSQDRVDRVLAYSLPLHVRLFPFPFLLPPFNNYSSHAVQSCLNYKMDDRFLEYSHDYVHYFIRCQGNVVLVAFKRMP